MVRPMTDLTQKNRPFTWGEACQTAFDNVKYALTHAPVLAHPQLDKPFEVICDASGFGVGVVLMQDNHPVA